MVRPRSALTVSGERYLRPGAQLGLRDEAFAAAMKRAEQGTAPPPPDPLDAVGRTRLGYVVRRNGERFMPGPLLDTSTLPLIED